MPLSSLPSLLRSPSKRLFQALVAAGLVSLSAGAATPTASFDAAAVSYDSALRTTLNNLSSRAHVGDGEEVLIAGFIIQGRHGKNVLVRAVGPGLYDYGISDFLKDPVVELYGSSGLIASNDDWMNPKEQGYVIEAAASTVGAFPLKRESKDAALYQSLAAGQYTAIVRGKAKDTGVALIELYDASCNCSEMLNVSARAFVSKKDEVQIAGFNIKGPNLKKVLIRASGPALAPFGLSKTLPDPSIEVYRQSDNTLLASNEDWYADPVKGELIDAERAKNGAFPWEKNSNDAALVLSLPAGAYTAVVRDKTGGTGVCLVEVYDANVEIDTN